MRIAIIASGSRGDVEPYIALGQGLKNAAAILLGYTSRWRMKTRIRAREDRREHS